MAEIGSQVSLFVHLDRVNLDLAVLRLDREEQVRIF